MNGIEYLYYVATPLIVGLIMYFVGKSKGYDNGWKSGMEASGILDDANQKESEVKDEYD